MDRDDPKETKEAPQGDQAGEEARKELDEIPEPGTDPLHEGP